MSEAAAAAAAAAPAADTPAPVESLTPEAARAEIEALKGDNSFYKRLVVEKDEASNSRWSALHKQAFPAPAPLTPEQMPAHEAARIEQDWNNYFSFIGQRFPLNAEQQAEIRNGVVNADLHKWAQEEKGRLIKDRGFYRKLLDGDRQANKDWGIVTSVLSLRPVKDFQWRKPV